MRRLPVYLLLDTSGSMSGEPIESVRSGLQLLVTALRQDPYALETAHLSVITFNSSAQQIVPLTELTAFQAPDLNVSGTTALGEALTLLADCITREVTKGSAEQKGDWKPAVFILTDGGATDDLNKGIAALKTVSTSTIVACAAGQHASPDELRKITEAVVTLDTADASTLKAFFQWVSASISTTSAKIETAGKEVSGLDELPPPPAELNIVA